MAESDNPQKSTSTKQSSAIERITKSVEDICSFMPENTRFTAEEKQQFIQQASKKKEDVHECDGYKFLPPFPPETIVTAYKEWNPNSGVVLVVTFPKTGQ